MIETPWSKGAIVKFLLDLSLAGLIILPGFACTNEKADEVVCEEMISDINSAFLERFNGSSIFECANTSECSPIRWQTACYQGCNGLVLTAKKDELEAFLGGSEVVAICDRYQKNGCGRIEDDCPS
jgi:hypothetical protein